MPDNAHIDVVTEAYFTVVSARGRYRYVCNGQEMKRPTSLYDTIADVYRYARLQPGDTIEPVVFTARYWIKRDKSRG